MMFSGEASMVQRPWKLYLRLTLIGLFLLVVVTTAVLWMRPPLIFYIQLTTPHELPTRLARSAFEYVTDRELPHDTEDLVIVFTGGSDPSLFLRFKTNATGIKHIVESFGGYNGSDQTLGASELASKMRSGWKIFPGLSHLESQVGLRLLDETAIGSVRLLGSDAESDMAVGYRILIDDTHSTVYVGAMRY